MAYADYYHCDVCNAKAFYDANIDWEHTNLVVSEWGAPESLWALCKECAKTHEVVIKKKEGV